jgi:DDE superfamily endonuclease
LWHALGVRRRRLRQRPLKATPEEQAAFRAELETRREDWPEEWAWLGVDEATVRRHPPLTAPWCLLEAVAEVPTGDDPPTGQVDGAVAPLTGRTHDPVSPTWGKEEFATFLPHLWAYYPNNQLLVIHDRGEQHNGAPVDALVREAKGRLVLKAQPAYAPELNPQERIWKWWRHVVTHHPRFVTLKEHSEALRNFFRDLAGVKDQVRQLCGFKTPDSFVASL